MRDGERQVAATLEGIRADHVARYRWAAQYLGGGRRVLDIACGVGYGSWLLAEAGNKVIGADIDQEAIDYANQHWKHDRARFQTIDASSPVAVATLGGFDAAVCFETIEHIEDPRPLLKALRGSCSVLLASVPNEDEFPYRGYAFHHRHYTRAEFAALLNECGWSASGWYGQEGPHSDVATGAKGRTLVVMATREKQVTGPRHVAILGLGPSVTQYLERTKRLGGRRAFCDETWGINAVGDVFACDRIFHMDDVRVQEARAKRRPESNIARMVEWLKGHPGPIYTSVPSKDYPGMVAFPLADVLTKFPNGYFNSTAAYAVAYAIYIGVQKISCFGMDFTYPDAHHAEKGRACVEFWLGVASERGIQLSVPQVSSLLDALAPPAERFYGYDCVDLAFSRQGERVEVSMTPRDVPDADEVEARYDHNVHPNALVE